MIVDYLVHGLWAFYLIDQPGIPDSTDPASAN